MTLRGSNRMAENAKSGTNGSSKPLVLYTVTTKIQNVTKFVSFVQALPETLNMSTTFSMISTKLILVRTWISYGGTFALNFCRHQ